MHKDYPAASFVIRHGHLIAIVAALGLVALGAWAVLDGAPLWAGALLAGSGAAAYLLLRSFAELVRILFDILIPE